MQDAVLHCVARWHLAKTLGKPPPSPPCWLPSSGGRVGVNLPSVFILLTCSVGHHTTGLCKCGSPVEQLQRLFLNGLTARLTFFLPLVKREALRLPLIGSAFRPYYLQSLRKIDRNLKPQQGMALLSKLRLCQLTCSCYIKPHAAWQRA